MEEVEIAKDTAMAETKAKTKQLLVIQMIQIQIKWQEGEVITIISKGMTNFGFNVIIAIHTGIINLNVKENRSMNIKILLQILLKIRMKF